VLCAIEGVWRVVVWQMESTILGGRSTSEMVVLLRMQMRIGYRNRQKNSTILTREIPTGKIGRNSHSY
jgi:hypothetical protein